MQKEKEENEKDHINDLVDVDDDDHVGEMLTAIRNGEEQMEIKQIGGICQV